MINRLVVILIIVPLAIVLIAFAVANRGWVPITFDPFNPGNPALTYSAPLFVLLFFALAFGVLLGGIATWLRQGRYRKIARQREVEAQALRQRQQQELKRVPGATIAKSPAAY